MPKQVLDTTTRSLLAIAQGLVDGVLQAPSSIDANLIRRARVEADAPNLAQPYQAAANAWQSAQKALERATRQADLAATQVQEANGKYDRVTSTVVYSQELMDLRNRSEQADLAVDRVKGEYESMLLAHDSAQAHLTNKGGLPGWVARKRFFASHPGPVVSGLSRLLDVEDLVIQAKTRSAQIKQLREDKKQAQLEAEQAKEALVEAVSTHPNVRAAFADKEAALRERGRLVRQSQEVSQAVQQYAAQLWNANQERWNQPNFQELVQAVADLNPSIRVKLHDDLNRLAGRPTTYPDPPPVQRTRIAGAPTPRTRIEVPSPAAELFSTNSVVWWMLLYPADYGHSTEVRRQCNSFVNQLSRDENLVQTVSDHDPGAMSTSASNHGYSHASGSDSGASSSSYSSSSSYDSGSSHDNSSSYDSSSPSSYDSSF